MSKQTSCRLPPLSFRINLKNTSCHISINLMGLYLFPVSAIFSETCISHHGCGKFSNIWCSKLLENAFAGLKIESRHFYSCSSRLKSPPGSYHTPQAEGNYSSPQTAFFQKLFCLPAERGVRKLWLVVIFSVT